MNPKALKRRIAFIFSQYFVLVVIGFVVVILGLGYLIFIQGIVSDIQEVGMVDLTSQLQTLDQRRVTLERLEDLQLQYQQITHDQVRQVESVLPTAAEIPQIMIELKDFVLQNQLDLRALDSGPLQEPVAAPSATVKTLNISLTIDGIVSYAKLKDFLDNVSQRLPLLELNAISYSPSNTSYTLNCTLYYQ